MSKNGNPTRTIERWLNNEWTDEERRAGGELLELPEQLIRQLLPQFSNCPYCGLPFHRVCPSCGTQVHGDWSFCGGCGSSLDSDQPARQLPPSPKSSANVASKAWPMLLENKQHSWIRERAASAKMPVSKWLNDFISQQLDRDTLPALAKLNGRDGRAKERSRKTYSMRGDVIDKLRESGGQPMVRALVEEAMQS